MNFLIAAAVGAGAAMFASKPIRGLLKKNKTTEMLLGEGRVNGAIGAVAAVLVLAMLKS